MTFLIDENLPELLVVQARDHGHKAQWVRNLMPGATDQQILSNLRQTSRVLVTRDLKFANTFYHAMILDDRLAGAVLIREERIREIEKAWLTFLRSTVEISCTLVVLDRGKIRVRSLTP